MDRADEGKGSILKLFSAKSNTGIRSWKPYMLELLIHRIGRRSLNGDAAFVAPHHEGHRDLTPSCGLQNRGDT